MAELKPVEVLTDIADAIREKTRSSALLKPVDFAARINTLQSRPPTGWSDRRRTYRFPNLLTQAQEIEMSILRLDGRPLYENVDAEMYNAFKGDWIRYFGEIHGLPLRPYPAFASVVVGDKIYLGSTYQTTSIVILDTLTGRYSEIEGLPDRVYTRLQLIGTKIYCLHLEGNQKSYHSIVCIDTTDNTFKEIMIPGLQMNNWSASTIESIMLIGNRLFLGARNHVVLLGFLNIDTDVVGTIPLPPGDTQFGNGCNVFIAAGNKLYASSNVWSTSGILVVDTTKIGTAENPVKRITVPDRIYHALYLAGTYLYAATNGNQTSIIRINTTNDTAMEITGLPSRNYCFESDHSGISNRRSEYSLAGRLFGTKLFLGSTTQATSIIVISNATGVAVEIPGLPNREYYSFQLVGTNKLYVIGGLAPGPAVAPIATAGTTLVVLDTEFNTFSEITGLPSRAYTKFFLRGTTLWLLSNGTTIPLINTNNDTFTEVTGLPQYRHNTVTLEVANRLYFGTVHLGYPTYGSTVLPIIDLATNTVAEQITGMPGRSQNALLFLNGKIYVIGHLSTGGTESIIVLADSVLPNHDGNIYIKYGD